MDAVGIWLLVLVVMPFFMFFCRIAINRRQNASRQAALRNARARRTQVPTVSGSINASSTSSFDTPSTSQRASDENIKVDLPPTYEDVMKTFLNAKDTTTVAPSEPITGASLQSSTHGISTIDIEEPPPPQYSNIM